MIIETDDGIGRVVVGGGVGYIVGGVVGLRDDERVV